MKKIAESIDNIAANILKPIEIATEFSALDNLTRGLRRQEETIIAARPSMGKTSLMLDIIKTVAQSYKTAIFSMEQNTEQLIDRMIGSEQGVTVYDLMDGKVKVKPEVITKLKNLKLSIDDTVGITTAHIWSELEKENYDIVFVDYINLFRKSNRINSRHEEIGEVVQQLRNIARLKNVAMVGICQLNRELEHREKHRPRLSDLRDSGEIEQIADNIVLIHRPSYYQIFEEGNVEAEDDYEAELIVAKNRNGPVGKCSVVWRPYLSSFCNPQWELEKRF